MNPNPSPFFNSITKKYLMAASGFVLAGFVMVHMLGNLQVFLGQDALNAYAYKLQSIPAVLISACFTGCNRHARFNSNFSCS